MNRRTFLATTGAVAAASLAGLAQQPRRRLLYIAQPGIRNYQQYGGVGVLVYDIDRDYAFVRRIPTWAAAPGKEVENVKGVAASAATGRLWVTTISRLLCIDLATDKVAWDVAPAGGCDRLSASPDGRTLYVPSFEGPHWNVIDGLTGETRTSIVVNSGAHNTLYAPDGAHVYLAGLKSPYLNVADAATHAVTSKVGPFSASIRPFTVDAARGLAYVNVNERLGFEIGDLRTGAVLHKVDVTGYQKGPVARHGCPSHGIGLTPDGTRSLALRRPQPGHARLRRHGHAAEADRDHQAARSARLDHLQPRRPARLAVDGRSRRREDEEDRQEPAGRDRPPDRQREAARDRCRGHHAGRRGQLVRRRWRSS